MKKINKGIIYIIIASLCFGAYGTWAKLIGNDFGNFFQGWTRALIIIVFLLPFLIYKKQLVKIEKKDYLYFTIFGIFTAATQAPLFYAFNHMDISSATLLFFVSYLITMYIGGIFFLKERMTFIKLISFLIAMSGLYLVFSFSWKIFVPLAVFMAILNGIASGGEVSSSKKISDKYSPLYITFFSWVVVLITNLPISILLGENQVSLSFSSAWFYQLGYSITSLFGFWLMIKGLKYIESSIGGLLGLLEVVFGVSLGIFIFHDNITYNLIFGTILIILAAGLPHTYNLINSRKNNIKL